MTRQANSAARDCLALHIIVCRGLSDLASWHFVTISLMSFFFFLSEVFNLFKFLLFCLYLSILDSFSSLHFFNAWAEFLTQHLFFMCHDKLHTLHLALFRFMKVKEPFSASFFLSLFLSLSADSVFSAFKEEDLLLFNSSRFSISIDWATSLSKSDFTGSLSALSCRAVRIGVTNVVYNSLRSWRKELIICQSSTWCLIFSIIVLIFFMAFAYSETFLHFKRSEQLIVYQCKCCSVYLFVLYMFFSVSNILSAFMKSVR